MLVPSLAAKKSVALRKVRELPIPGEILVRPGDLVEADKIVARATLPGDLHIIRLSELMGITRDEALKGVKVEVGEQVSVQTILCEHAGIFGLFRSKLTAGIKGVVEFVSTETAHVGIRGDPTIISLNAYIRSRVAAIEGKQAVVLVTQAAFVQGIFGVGGERAGKIQLLPISAAAHIGPENIPAESRGKILVGGSKPSVEALRFAAAAGAVGFVCGSIDDVTLAAYVGHDIGVAITGDEEVPMTLVITEGFGELPISEKVLGILGPLNGFEASINGATQVRAGALRPEIIVPIVASGAEEKVDLGDFALGQKVRVIRVPYFGVQAEIIGLPKKLVMIETGAESRVLQLKLASGEEVTVPRANVELI